MAEKEETDSSSELKAPPFPIVGVGASAGGLEALEELFAHTPKDIGMAFVVVTHQHPSHTSLLPELLGRSTQLPVIAAKDGVGLQPNHVYVAPPGTHMALLNESLHFMDPNQGESIRLPIDYFFRSLAEDKKERAIGIILSGTATDGTLGVKAIKGESGMAMVQEPQTAKYAGMPSSAIASGCVDFILPAEKMAEQLAAYAKGISVRVSPIETPPDQTLSSEPLQKIFLLLRSRTGNDFSLYKTNTIRRRIERRMNVHQIDEPSHYVRYLQENPHEIDILFKEMLISVTSFFRDPKAFEALAKGALLELIRSHSDGHHLRIWVPGCATGEEAYSLAILVDECLRELNRHFEVQIFGTDLDAEAIETARAGVYPGGIAIDVSAERLERHFLQEDHVYRVNKEIRDMLVFAPHNIIKDPPFTKLDMISCRNLLIYLNAELQQRLLPIFHYALKSSGLLFLGPSETIGNFDHLFVPLDKRWKIFQRIGTAEAAQVLPEMPAEGYVQGDVTATKSRSGPPALAKDVQLSTLVERLLLDRFAPTSVVCNERGGIVYIHGRTGNYLEPVVGKPRHNLLEMAREGLRLELSTALRQASTQKQGVARPNVRVKTNGSYVVVNLAVEMIKQPEAIHGLFLVSMVPVPPPDDEVGEAKDLPSSSDSVNDLERELQYTKESLQNTVEELETSNEELKSTNEELQSTNEELQSSNEELETSKEEMQSLNEELTTVNSELTSKIEDLSQANDDMQNLLNSTDIATLFLDNDLNISRYTEQAKRLINVIPSDVGRPFGDLAINLDYDRIPGDAAEVLDRLVFKEEEVQANDGSWYLMRIMPYRTAENVIDGLVITFVNIDRIKTAEEEGQKAGAFFRSIVDTVRQPILVLDSGLRVVSANKAFLRCFRTSHRQTEGELVYELGGGEWDIPSLRKLLENVLPDGPAVEDFEVDHTFPKIGHRAMMLNACRLEALEGEPHMILLAMEDVTQP